MFSPAQRYEEGAGLTEEARRWPCMHASRSHPTSRNANAIMHAPWRRGSGHQLQLHAVRLAASIASKFHPTRLLPASSLLAHMHAHMATLPSKPPFQTERNTNTIWSIKMNMALASLCLCTYLLLLFDLRFVNWGPCGVKYACMQAASERNSFCQELFGHSVALASWHIMEVIWTTHFFAYILVWLLERRGQ